MRRARTVSVILVIAGLLAAGFAFSGSEDATAPGSADVLEGVGADDTLGAQLEGSGLVRESGGTKPRVTRGEVRAADQARTGERPRVVVGRVVDENGDHVPGVLIRYSKPGAGGTTTDDLESDEYGRFRLSHPPAGRRRVWVVRTSSHSQSAVVDVGADTADLALTVQRSPNVAGIVLDDRGAPLPDVLVQLYASQAGALASTRTVFASPLASARSREDGRFAVRILPSTAQRVDVRFQAPFPSLRDQLPEHQPPVALGSTDLVLRFGPPAYISGHVEDEAGNPVQGVHVRLRGDTRPRRHVRGRMVRAHTSSEFRLGPLSPGTHELVVDVLDAFVGVPGKLTVRAPAEDVVIVCPPFRGIRGRVVGHEGEDLSRFIVTWFAEQGTETAERGTAQVARDGAFHIALAGSPACTLSVRSRGDQRVAGASGVVPSAKPIALQLREGYSISGHVVGGFHANGREVVATQGQRSLKVTTRGTGTFRFMGLGPGIWYLHVRGLAGGRVRSSGSRASVAAGSTGVRLALD